MTVICKACGRVRLIPKGAEKGEFFWFCHRRENRSYCWTMNKGLVS